MNLLMFIRNITLAILLSISTAQASERWRTFETICDSSKEAMEEFYASEELVPLIGGGGLVPTSSDNWEAAVHYIMWDQDDSIAIIRYINGEACLLGVMRNLEWDTDTLWEIIK